MRRSAPLGGVAARRDAGGMKTKPTLAAATTALALALALAPSAFGQDFCVADSACVSAGGTDKLTVDAALGAADATVAPDRVLIGPGTFTAPTTAGFKAQASPVQIIGSGAGATTLTGPVDTSVVLYVAGAESRVSNLGIAIPATGVSGLTKLGLYDMAASADHLRITADPAAGPVIIGAELFPGAALEDS